VALYKTILRKVLRASRVGAMQTLYIYNVLM